MDEKAKICPCCEKHCQAEELQCGKGRRYFDSGEETGERGRGRRGHGKGHHHRNCSRENETCEGKLLSQLRACGHFLRHNTGRKSGQSRILSILAEGEGMTQRNLQDILEVRSGSLSEILIKIEADGLIERSQNEMDKRQINICLTEEGKEAASKVGHQHQDLVQELFVSLSDEEKEQLSALLDKVLEDWDGRREKEDGEHRHRRCGHKRFGHRGDAHS